MEVAAKDQYNDLLVQVNRKVKPVEWLGLLFSAYETVK